jgi:subtilisin family serine protease/N-acetylneuraminic acid mutarotase
VAVTAGLLAAPAGAATPDDPPAAATERKIDKSLRRGLEATGEADFVVTFAARPNLTAAKANRDWASRGAAVVKALDATAASSQREARRMLDQAGVSYRSFSVANAIYVTKGSADLATLLAGRTEVAAVDAARTFALPKPSPATVQAAADGVEWGISQIRADASWADYKTRGEGIVVANIDSGVQYDHPALVASYRGATGDGTFDHNYNWYDPSAVCPPGAGPCDNAGHGTHTMGTMVGAGGDGNRIGVAPGARWIAAKGCEGGSCSTFALLASAQWVLAPTDLDGHNPRPDLRPHIVNNSWGSPTGPEEDPWYDAAIDAWVAAGMFPTFSVGNEGPDCDTAGTPGDSLASYSVGAYDVNGVITDFSSRGPGAEGDVKPNISAPGLAVRSSVPGSGYAVYDGTSMAAPHVSGAVGLLWSAAPGVLGDISATRALLDESAVDVDDTSCGGTAADNNVYGEGRLDIHRAIELAPRGPTGTVHGTVRSTTGDPVAGASIIISGPANRTIATDPDGTFSTRLPIGTFTLTAKAFGFGPGSARLTVAADSTSTQDFALRMIPRKAISGTVRESSDHGWPLYAKITVDDVPDGTYYTDPVTGRYRIELPVGTTYSVRTSAQYPGLSDDVGQVALGAEDTVRDIGLAVDDYSCTAPGYRAGTSRIAYEQTFDSPSAPEGWTVTDPLGNDQVWRFDDEAGFGNRTGGSGLYGWVFSAGYGEDGEQDTALVSPPIDLGTTRTPAIWFRTDYSDGPSSTADVDLSLDGGTTWTTVWRQTSGSISETQVRIPIPDAAGRSDVRVRFHYTASFDTWWQVDDVQIGDRICDAVPSALVTGHVRDANTGTALIGSTVRVAGVTAPVTTVETPQDRGLDDGFFWTVAGSGSKEVTAAHKRYATATKTVDLPTDQVTDVELAPMAGVVSVDQAALTTSTSLGGKTTATVTLRNDGTAPTRVDLAERPGDAGVVNTPTTQAPLQLIHGTYSPGPGPVTGTNKASAAAVTSPAGGPWAPLADYPTAIMDNAVAAYRGDLYSVGGRTATGATTAAYVYDAATAGWTRLADMPHPRQRASAAFLAGKLYVAGGWSAGGQARADMDVYDPVTDTWSTGPALPSQVTAAGTATLDDQLYAVGGCPGECGHREVYRYDASGRAWKQLANYPTNTSWLGCGGIDGAIYCAGGTTGDGGSVRTYRYNPGPNTWTRLADLPIELWGMVSTVSHGQLLLSGGVTDGDSTLTNQGFSYDPATNQWSELPNSQYALYRSGGSCGFAKIGGSTGGFVPSSAGEILPGYADCGSADPVGWLSASPESVTLAPGEQAKVTVTVDTAGLTQPGEYSAVIETRDTTPYTAARVGVTLNVAPPAGWGLITGTVTGADCGGGKTPLPGATVTVDGKKSDYTLRTDRLGRYALWLDERNSPLALTVTRDGWFRRTAQAKVTGGKTTTAAFTLTRTGCSIAGRTS